MRVARATVGAVSGPVVRSEGEVLRTLVIGAGLCWSILFAIIGLSYELALYADGSMFSYAVAAQDVWAFHWHNLSGRLSVFLLSLWPAELYVAFTGHPAGAIVVYGLLFYIAPLIGLIGSYYADRSKGRMIFVYACCSTALLCPLVFGFPTEMWLAHALFWPALAVSLYARLSTAGASLVFVMLLALMFTHEAALVLAFTIAATLALRGLRNASFLRTAGALTAALTVWITVKVAFPPGNYFADVLVRAALHFFDPAIFEVPLVLLLIAALAGYGLFLLAASRLAPGKAHFYAAAIVAAGLAVYWLWFDNSIHASNRYYLRTMLVIVIPMLAGLAALHVMHADGLALPNTTLARATTMLSGDAAARTLASAFLLVTLIHAVETTKFVLDWTRYKTAVTALATGSASDPALGDARFVSSDRIAPELNRLSWFSTTHYLSAIVANFNPNRLVIDPKNNYFWLSCNTASTNVRVMRAVPVATRDLVRNYACLHR